MTLRFAVNVVVLSKVIARIEDPVVIRKILTHLMEKTTAPMQMLLLEVRAPPQESLFD